MSIVGWYHEAGRRFVSLDDPCMDRVMPKFVRNAFVEKEDGDERHSGREMTVTGANGCPRKLAMSRALDVRPEPNRMWKMFGGTMLHEWAGSKCNGDWLTEERDRGSCEVEFMFEGVKLKGLADCVRKDRTRIGDWKFSFSGADQWVNKDGSSGVLHAVQGNLLRMGFEEKWGVKFTGDIDIWVVGKTWKLTKVPYMTKEQILATPVGATNSIKAAECWKWGQLFEDVKRWNKWWGEKVEEYGEVPVGVLKAYIKGMPLYGKKMWVNRKGGNMCTSLCELQRECLLLDGGL
jgi:hypothetical protein